MMIRINQEESKNPDFLALHRSNNSESLGYAGDEPPDRAGQSLIEFQDTQLGGYWNGNGANSRENELMRRLGMRRGMTLFGVDPGKLRAGLERIPCVESARVYRVLPDTLRMELVERTPRAVLFDRASPLVADENGIVIDNFSSKKQSSSHFMAAVTIHSAFRAQEEEIGRAHV